MFNRMLDHPNIQIQLESEYHEVADNIDYEQLIYTGPIDAYFNYKLGKLPYRSLRFEHEHLENQEYFQKVGTVNYPNNHEYTRITEFKHLTDSISKGTSIVKEYPTDEGDPYYPIPRRENEELLKKYEALAEGEKDVHFVGRLAQYRYFNMDQVVAAALAVSAKIINPQA